MSIIVKTLVFLETFVLFLIFPVVLIIFGTLSQSTPLVAYVIYFLSLCFIVVGGIVGIWRARKYEPGKSPSTKESFIKSYFLDGSFVQLSTRYFFILFGLMVLIDARRGLLHLPLSLKFFYYLFERIFESMFRVVFRYLIFIVPLSMVIALAVLALRKQLRKN